MARFSMLLLLAASAQAFTITPSISSRTAPSTMLFEATDSNGNPVERGVSVDQDGKSNVWAIEPKVEVQNKSSEEQGQSALIAGGGLAVCAAAAAFILTNLPDPSQF